MPITGKFINEVALFQWKNKRYELALEILTMVAGITLLDALLILNEEAIIEGDYDVGISIKRLQGAV